MRAQPALMAFARTIVAGSPAPGCGAPIHWVRICAQDLRVARLEARGRPYGAWRICEYCHALHVG
eukprot:1217670-Pleurochrysis_carterae.AAC.1